MCEENSTNTVNPTIPKIPKLPLCFKVISMKITWATQGPLSAPPLLKIAGKGSPNVWAQHQLSVSHSSHTVGTPRDRHRDQNVDTDSLSGRWPQEAVLEEVTLGGKQPAGYHSGKLGLSPLSSSGKSQDTSEFGLFILQLPFASVLSWGLVSGGRGACPGVGDPETQNHPPVPKACTSATSLN